MALSRFMFGICVLLLSLVVIASAGDYGYGSKTNLENSKPNGDNGYGYGYGTYEAYTPPPYVEEAIQNDEGKMNPPAAYYGYAPESSIKEGEKPKQYTHEQKPKEEKEKQTGTYEAYAPPPNVEGVIPNAPPASYYGYAPESSIKEEEKPKQYTHEKKPKEVKEKQTGDYGYGTYEAYAPPPNVEEAKPNDEEKMNPPAAYYGYVPESSINEEENPHEEGKPKKVGDYASNQYVEEQKPKEEKDKQTVDYTSKPADIEEHKFEFTYKQNFDYSYGSTPIVEEQKPEEEYKEKPIKRPFFYQPNNKPEDYSNSTPKPDNYSNSTPNGYATEQNGATPTGY